MHYNRLVYSTMSCFSTKNYGQRLTIFVGGICTSISEDLLLSYFSQFGQIHWITFQPRGHGFKRSANEGVSEKQPHRGCGLLKMNNEQGFDAVLQRKIHHFQNSTMECRPALSAGDRKRLNQQIAKEGRKVFVGGLPQSIEKHTLYEFFSRIVEIEDITLIKKEDREHSFCFLFLRGKGTGKVLYGNEYIIQEGVKVRCQEPLTQQQITEQKQEELAAEQKLSYNKNRITYKQGVDAVQQDSTGNTSTNFAAHAIQAGRAMVSEQLDHRPQNVRFRRNRLQRPLARRVSIRSRRSGLTGCKAESRRWESQASDRSGLPHETFVDSQVGGCLHRPSPAHDGILQASDSHIDSSADLSEAADVQVDEMYRYSCLYRSFKLKHRSLGFNAVKHYTPFCF